MIVCVVGADPTGTLVALHSSSGVGRQPCPAPAAGADFAREDEEPVGQGGEFRW